METNKVLCKYYSPRMSVKEEMGLTLPVKGYLTGKVYSIYNCLVAKSKNRFILHLYLSKVMALSNILKVFRKQNKEIDPSHTLTYAITHQEKNSMIWCCKIH